MAFTVSAEAVSVRVAGNGLTVLAKSAPPKGLVAVHVSINAGSSLEAEYCGSGISHLVEHMVFKGTRTRGPGAVEKETKSYGAFLNGSVNQDLTDFYITVPPENLESALSLIEDVLSNALFDEAEISREKDVILKEMNLGEDDPERTLIKALNETAYLEHPYRYPVIGYKDSFISLRREDLVKYYNRTYVPAKMVIAVVGDIEEDAAISSAIKQFEGFGRNNRYIPALRQEKDQICARQRTIRMPVELAYLGLGFHSTSLLDPDLYATDVLAMILGRGDGSRLHTELVKKERLVYSVSAWNHTPRYPGLFVITAALDKDKVNEAQRAIVSEVEKIKKGHVSDEELDSAKRMALSDYIFSQQTDEGMAEMIATGYITAGDADFARSYVSGIESVSKEAVISAANKYLIEDSVNVVRILPVIDDGAAVLQPKIQISDAPVLKEVLPNGMRVLVKEDHRTPAISITAAMLGGVAAEDEADNGISNLVARMLLKGTSTRKEDRISKAIEALGGKIDAFSGFNGFGIQVDMLKEDFREVVDILKDVLTDPAFPDEEIEKEKSIIIASIRQEDDDIFRAGSSALRRYLFTGSPYALRHLGRIESVSGLKRYDLVGFYSKYGVAGNTVISVVGDVDAKKVFSVIRDIFGGMSAGPVPSFSKKIPASIDGVKVEKIEMERKESLVMLGFRVAGIRDADRYSLDVLASVLSGHSGRIFNKLRGASALAYALGCSNRPMLDAGYMLFYVATTGDNLTAAEKALLEEINRVRKSEVDEKELTAAKKEICLNRSMQKQSNAFFSTETAIDELYGLGADNIYRYESLIANVTADDLKRCAVRYLDPSSYVEVIIHPEP